MKRSLLLCVLSLLVCLSACLALAEETGEAVPQDFVTLNLGDASEAVTALQNRLRDIGYLTEKATGSYDEATRDAVLRVQDNYGIEETGVADPDTQELIFGECYMPLKSGDSGDLVKALQQRLKAISLYSDAVDGKYGATTEQGVQIFQKLYGLEVTGAADINTLTMLYSDLNDREILPAPTPTPQPGAITVTTGETVKFTKKLAYGSTGANVQKLQERLKELGFFTYKKTTTGFYKNTQAAVKQFQEYNSLPVTGTVDEATWNAIFNDASAVPASATPRPSPEPTPVPYFVDVDVRNQVTKVFTYDENGDYTVLARVMICSTGTTSYPSKPGTYTLTGRKARWCTFPKWGGGTAQYWTKINSEIAFHSIMYINYDPDRPNMSTFNHLGKRASHGCIRLHTQDAKWVYNNIGAGTQVYIHNDSNTDSELVAFAKYHKSNPGDTVLSAEGYDFNAAPPAYRRMRSGAFGSDVLWAQLTLEQLGYFKDTTATGYYGPLTASAVKRFQKANGIKVDGVLGEKTYAALCAAQIKAQPTPVPADTPAPTQTAAPETAAKAQ